MSIDSTVSAPQDQAEVAENAPDLEELLVEEVSIDGMCGVY
jgi:mycofactocin precursor